ncbi:MAG: formimidoylglutamase [Planctomycetota bacterium]|nr:formimidoylglutamase [Planctomycetota bacterium]
MPTDLPRLIPHTTAPGRPGHPSPAGRFVGTIRTDSPKGCAIALLGMPDDTGVKLNGGRPGASEGPAAFRAALARMGTATPAGFGWPGVFDAGDVVPASASNEPKNAESDADRLHTTHARVTEAVGAILDLGLFPIGIGGGHDLTFPFVRALTARVTPLEVVSFDPHLDVRAEVGSGMPFRALVEQCDVAGLHNVGASDMANSAEHVEYFTSHNGTLHPDDGCDDLFGATGPDLTVSFDLDLLDASCAPGVSAMNPCGWSSPDAATAVLAAGRCARVRCFDIMELSPPHDRDNRTARLAAHLFLTFLRGYAERTP